MIRPLRRAHRVVWTLLAMALPLLYALALILRAPEPTVDRLPKASSADERAVSR